MDEHLFSLNAEAVARKLQTWGYLDVDIEVEGIPWTNADLKLALSFYQGQFKFILDYYTNQHHSRISIPDGDVGPATTTLFTMPRCDCPDFYASGPEEANWPDACRMEITTAYVLDDLNLSQFDIKTRWNAALDSWNEPLKLKLILTGEMATARIWARDGALGGSTLAWSYLANNSCNTRLEQRYNTRVNWNPQYFQGVVAHEIGHALGLRHIDSPEALMYPYARQSVYEPQELDIEAMVESGYELADPEPPPPPPPTGDVVLISGTINGKEYRLVSTDGGDTSSDWFWG